MSLQYVQICLVFIAQGIGPASLGVTRHIVVNVQ